MSVLDKKLFRDLRRLWAQALAIALVIGGGVATLILAAGSYRSLDEYRVSDEEIVTAMTTGKRPDGRMLAPMMPWH
jgi:hypothetical protein